VQNEHRAYGWKSSEEGCSHAYLLPAVTKILAERLGRRRARVIDLGCGNGHVTGRLAALGYDAMGLDVSEDGIRVAREAHPDLRFEVASVYDEGFEATLGGPVDAVVALEVVEHLFYPKRLFEQSRRVLRDGGLLVVSTPYHGYWKNLALSLVDGWDRHFSVDWDGGHIKFFSARSLGRMAEAAGFRRLEFTGVGRLPYLWKSLILVAER
jgi:2-polyprenyl-3-methyl-5-hydroxy-6-metoxy-1,4-benzoquinol methylase